MEEKYKITIKIEGVSQYKPNYTNVERVFEIKAPILPLTRTLEEMGKKLSNLYPLNGNIKNVKTNEEIAEMTVRESNAEQNPPITRI